MWLLGRASWVLTHESSSQQQFPSFWSQQWCEVAEFLCSAYGELLQCRSMEMCDFQFTLSSPEQRRQPFGSSVDFSTWAEPCLLFTTWPLRPRKSKLKFTCSSNVPSPPNSINPIIYALSSNLCLLSPWPMDSLLLLIH